MTVDKAINIDDLRLMARRRLPRMAFDFIEGGVDGERCLARNEAAFERYRIVPRYFVDITNRSQTAGLFGRTYASPFGICPTGMAGLWRPGTDLMLARAAAKADIPFLLSCASSNSVEDAVAIAPDNIWFQIYGARERHFTETFFKRAHGLGLRTVVVTMDVPVTPNRERNLRNGFGRPLRLGPRTVLDGLRHPGWLIDFLRHGGIPVMQNWATYAKPGATANEVADLYSSQTPAPDQTWKDVESFRKMWPHRLVLKGVMSPEDAAIAQSLGLDGLIVSNHGGRQLDYAPSPVEMLPFIRAAVGDQMAVMLDSGVRRGSDIVLANCLGADFVFVGRATLYGAAAGGQRGVDRAVAILRREVDLVMGQMGATGIDALGPHSLLQEGLNGLEEVPDPAQFPAPNPELAVSD